jgi:hypothetical protein
MQEDFLVILVSLVVLMLAVPLFVLEVLVQMDPEL